MFARIIPVLACVCVLGVVAPADALFLKPDLEKIPVERLIKNLNDQLAKETKPTTTTRYNLARVHAMAYALKVDTVEIQKKRMPGDGPWFGYTPPTIPFKPVEAPDKAKAEAAQKHLDKAIATYRDLLKDQPNFLPGHLGLAWALEQAGQKEDAIKTYRDVLEKAWDVDRKKKAGPLGGNFLTKEAGMYLLGLLDKDNDADEIASIEQRIALLSKLPRPVTPIAVPLKNGLAARDLEDRNASVLFDADGTATGKRWTWITIDAAWLVHVPCSKSDIRNPKSETIANDHNEKRRPPFVDSAFGFVSDFGFRISDFRSEGGPKVKITSGLQLFGNVSFWCFWDNGYQAMRVLDDNGDGVLSGDELRDLALWHDANGNGICEPGEVRSLAQHGIVRLACDYQMDGDHPDRIAFSPRGVTYEDGTTRPTFDLILHSR